MNNYEVIVIGRGAPPGRALHRCPSRRRDSMVS